VDTVNSADEMGGESVKIAGALGSGRGPGSEAPNWFLSFSVASLFVDGTNSNFQTNSESLGNRQTVFQI